jgi:transglutaminase-like putative cysteine protease
MRFQVRHTTSFDYSHPVFLEPQTIRLKPRTDFRQHLARYSLEMEPAPSQVFELLDLEGNLVSCARFVEPTDSLVLTSDFLAETEDVNPFNFVLSEGALSLPLTPGAAEPDIFEFYARTRSPPAVIDLAQNMAQAAEYRTVEFITGLNAWVHDNHEKINRPMGPPWEPTETLRQGRGSCRDLAVLFIAACRALNIPARFVSGYSAASQDSDDEQQLHAWAEVYLPGAGWRGFDPSLGLAITESHLAVAAAADPVLATPTSGTFRGGAESRLAATIQL